MDRKVAQRNESSEQPASSVSERNGKTWHSLGEIYGARWCRENGDLPGRVWCSMLNALTDAEIGNALALLVKQPRTDARGNIHPPAAPEFWAAAKAGQPRTTTLIEDHSRDFSKYAKGASMVLLSIIRLKGGLGKETLAAVLREKARVVMDFEMLAKEEDVEWKHFIMTMDNRLLSVVDKMKEQPPSQS